MIKKGKLTAILILTIFSIAEISYTQNLLGQAVNQGLIRIAEPGQLADTLNLWGDIRNPGRYMVPLGTSLPELISYARGPITSDPNAGSKIAGIEIFVSRYISAEKTETLKIFRFTPNQPLPEELRIYNLQNNDIITLKTKRRGSFGQTLRNVTPFITLIITGLLAYDQLRE